MPKMRQTSISLAPCASPTTEHTDFYRTRIEPLASRLLGPVPDNRCKCNTSRCMQHLIVLTFLPSRPSYTKRPEWRTSADRMRLERAGSARSGLIASYPARLSSLQQAPSSTATHRPVFQDPQRREPALLNVRTWYRAFYNPF